MRYQADLHRMEKAVNSYCYEPDFIYVDPQTEEILNPEAVEKLRQYNEYHERIGIKIEPFEYRGMK